MDKETITFSIISVKEQPHNKKTNIKSLKISKNIIILINHPLILSLIVQIKINSKKSKNNLVCISQMKKLIVSIEFYPLF